MTPTEAQGGFLSKIWSCGSDKPNKRAKTLFETFLENVHQEYPLNAQMARSARLFAACAAGLMLASEWAISGITAKQAQQGIMRCFADWYALQPKGSIEEARSRETAESWMQQYAHSHRFSHWIDAHTKPEHAGFYRYTKDELKALNARSGKRLKPEELDTLQEWWIIPAVFEREICNDYEAARVCAILHRLGWLRRYETDSVKRWKHQRYGKGWFYVLQGIQPPETNDNDQ